MRSGVIAQKVGMTRVFTGAGEHVPVTVLKVDGCQVVAHRTQKVDGYTSLQLGIGRAKVKNVTKAERGRFAVANVEPKMKLAEFRILVEGAVPGVAGGWIFVRDAIKKAPHKDRPVPGKFRTHGAIDTVAAESSAEPASPDQQPEG